MIPANEVGCQFVFGCVGAHFPAMTFGYEIVSRVIGLLKAIGFGGFLGSRKAVCFGISIYGWDAIRSSISRHNN